MRGLRRRLPRRWALAQPHRYRLLFARAARRATTRTARSSSPPPSVLMASLLARVLGDEGDRAIRAWWRVHGFVSLEIEGNFASMGLATDRLFRAEVESL